MNLSNSEEKLFDEGVTFATDQLVLSKVKDDVDLDEEEFKFVADVYATEIDEDSGVLHFRFFDGNSVEFEPYLKYKEHNVAEITIPFKEKLDENDNFSYFEFLPECESANILFSDGKYEGFELSNISNFRDLILASKIFFLDIIRLAFLAQKSSNHNLEK